MKQHFLNINSKIFHQTKTIATVFILTICSHSLFAQRPQEINPLLIHSNAPIPFDKVNSTIIKEAASEVLAKSDHRIKKIVSIAPGRHTFSNTLKAFDELGYDILDLFIKCMLIAGTYEADSIRNAARNEQEKLSLYRKNLYLNEGLYHALKQYAITAEPKKLPVHQQKYLRESILLFEKNGTKLDSTARKELKNINQKLVSYATQFDKNIAESKDSVAFNENDLTGVPDNIKEPWKRAIGNYVVYINGPNYNDILKYAVTGETRRIMYVYYNNRAYPKNLGILDSLLYYRNLYARKLGFRSFADYTLIDKMAASPENVWKFETNLVNKLTPQVTKELSELRQLKSQLQLESSDSLYVWDIAFYQNKLLDAKYKLNTDEVKQYFEMNNTLQGMFSVYEKLFNIQIKEIKSIPVWHAKVKSYEMYKDGKKSGSFYLDLYPRKNKFTHNACFPISFYLKADKKEVLPVSALVCNLPEGNAKESSLLSHSNVITLFHEFGHLVHSILGRSDIASQHSFGLKSDFIEAPSKLLENWCWEYEPLKMFARHYKTREVLPEPLFNKMKQTQLVGNSGILLTMMRLYAGILDFTYEDKYDSIKGKDLTQVSKDLFAITQLPFAEGSHFICNFIHLTSYGAQYYGYMWSEVFAMDMFTSFQSRGVMNTNTGMRYRKEILEKGATMEEMDMLRNFLGREPNSNAFLKSLRIQ